MSEGYKCRNANHNGDTCVGFCLNISCKHPSQFCLQCMKDQHLDHQDDCLGFVEIKKWLGDLIYVKSILKENLTKIQISFIELMEKAKKNQKVLFHSHNNKSKQEYDIQIVQILKNNEQSKFGYQTKISSINRLFTTCQQLIKSFDEQNQQQSINIQYRQNSPQKRLSSAADYFKGEIEQIPNQKPLGQVATSAQQYSIKIINFIKIKFKTIIQAIKEMNRIQIGNKEQFREAGLLNDYLEKQVHIKLFYMFYLSRNLLLCLQPFNYCL